MKKEEISGIIITYNIGKDIYKCYDSIKNQVDKVIIIDNGSNKATVNELKKIQEDEKSYVVYNQNNEGIATALNIGIKIADRLGYKWVITMDNDSIATNNMVNCMVKTYNSLEKDKKKEIVSLAVNFIECAYENTDDLKESENESSEYTYEDMVITSGNLVKIETFKEIGFFKEKYFIDAVDHEFCCRVIKNNYKIIKVKGALLKHKIGDGIEKKFLGKNLKSSNHSPLRRYYIVRNNLDMYDNYNELGLEYINDIKKLLFKTLFKIILMEDEKLKKISYMKRGYFDYKKSKFGKLEK